MISIRRILDRMRPVVFVDDRGEQLSSKLKRLQWLGLFQDRTTAPSMIASIQVVVLVLVGISLSMNFFSSTSARSIVLVHLIIFASVAGAIFAGVFLYRRMFVPRRIVPASSAWLCMHRHCGQCGYNMRQTPRTADGLVQCSECGATWHADRWTRESEDPRSPDGIPFARRVLTGQLLGFVNDHRSVPYPTASHKIPAWTKQHQSGTPVAAWRQNAQRLNRLLVSTGVVVVVSTLAITIYFVYFRTSTFSLPNNFEFPLVALFLLMLPVARYLQSRNPNKLQGLAIESGLCPICGEKLDGQQVSSFDQCVPCGHCGRAWKGLPAGK